MSADRDSNIHKKPESNVQRNSGKLALIRKEILLDDEASRAPVLD